MDVHNISFSFDRSRAPRIIETDPKRRIIGITSNARTDFVADLREAEKENRTEEIRSVLKCSLPTITTIRRIFVEGRMDNTLYDKPRPGAVPKFTGKTEAQLTLLACSAPREEKMRWIKLLRFLSDDEHPDAEKVILAKISVFSVFY